MSIKEVGEPDMFVEQRAITRGTVQRTHDAMMSSDSGVNMTMRTYRHFVCQNGHNGVEKTSENDQPYSTMCESVTVTGMRERGKDSHGYNAYVCTECEQPMMLTDKP